MGKKAMGEESEADLPRIVPEERDRAKTSRQDAARAISSKWEPSAEHLKQILARHIGWVGNRPGAERPVPEHDFYLESVEPAYPTWRV
jgi:hypothetical protein